MNKQSKGLLVFTLLAVTHLGYSQGIFGNLNFEQVNTNSPISIIGWTLYSGAVGYNTVSLGGAAITVHDSNSLAFQPLQGNYSVFMQGSGAGPAVSVAMSQTGQIPANSLSLRFWADPRSNLEVTFGGTLIPMVRFASTANFDVFGEDISSFAGQAGELRFTGPANSGGYFDNIFFSTQQIPEPIALGLFGLGALFLGWRLRRSV